MDSITLPMIAKTSHPVLTAVLLVIVGSMIAGVLYLLLRQRRRTRAAKKSGATPHTGRHGNH